MNKTVLEYLNGKANDVKDYIVAKAEAAGNYLSDHATDIKNGFVKGTATVLTAAMLLGGMTACDIGNVNTPGQIESPSVDNVKSKHVLAAIDDIAKNCFINDQLPRYPELEADRNKMKFTFDSISPKRSSVPITNQLMNGDMTMMTDPFYYNDENFTPNYHWIDDEIKLSNVYCLNFNYTVQIGDRHQDFIFRQFGIAKTDFENIMNAFNVESFIVTQEYLDSMGYAGAAYANLIGKEVYPTISITREMIESATPEQLLALYIATTNSMKTINLEGKLPLGYEMDIE